MVDRRARRAGWVAVAVLLTGCTTRQGSVGDLPRATAPATDLREVPMGRLAGPGTTVDGDVATVAAADTSTPGVAVAAVAVDPAAVTVTADLGLPNTQGAAGVFCGGVDDLQAGYGFVVHRGGAWWLFAYQAGRVREVANGGLSPSQWDPQGPVTLSLTCAPTVAGVGMTVAVDDLVPIRLDDPGGVLAGSEVGVTVVRQLELDQDPVAATVEALRVG